MWVGVGIIVKLWYASYRGNTGNEGVGTYEDQSAASVAVRSGRGVVALETAGLFAPFVSLVLALYARIRVQRKRGHAYQISRQLQAPSSGSCVQGKSRLEKSCASLGVGVRSELGPSELHEPSLANVGYNGEHDGFFIRKAAAPIPRHV